MAKNEKCPYCGKAIEKKAWLKNMSNNYQHRLSNGLHCIAVEPEVCINCGGIFIPKDKLEELK